MAIPVNLAMTGAEFYQTDPLPPSIAWMACHFSPSHGGLSNLPRELPAGSVLILNDQMPFSGHDVNRIQEELGQCVEALSCCALLLDFQRPEVPEAADLASALSLPCPVAVTPLYARGNDAAVFLPPVPCHTHLKEWTAPWKGRTLWLELALDREEILLTREGAAISPLDLEEYGGFADKILHCHYRAAVKEEQAVFHLWRTPSDLDALLGDAEKLGIQRAVGLYQELGAKTKLHP